jgi:hypothetical protein
MTDRNDKHTDKPPNVVPLRPRQPANNVRGLTAEELASKAKPGKPICQHGVPLHLDCPECHGADDDGAADIAAPG